MKSNTFVRQPLYDANKGQDHKLLKKDYKNLVRGRSKQNQYFFCYANCLVVSMK